MKPGWLAAPALLLALAVGCKEQGEAKASAPRERSQAVQATTPAPPAAPAKAAASTPPTPKKPRGALCPNLIKDGKSLPKKPVSQASVSDARLPEHLVADSSALTWVNFWAAWCAPCKEEIPRLVAWERELGRSGRRFRLALISLDDDERQLRQFLEGSAELKATYWLKEGKERDEWMKGAGLEVDPELPIHLLVDSRGKIRCKIQGAVEDADLAEFSRLVSAGGG